MLDVHIQYTEVTVVALVFPGSSVVKNLPANAGDVALISGSGRSPGEGNSNPLLSSCLENAMDSGAYGATVGYSSQVHKRVRHNLATKSQQEQTMKAK